MGIEVGQLVDVWWRQKWWNGGRVKQLENNKIYVLFEEFLYGKAWANPKPYKPDSVRPADEHEEDDITDEENEDIQMKLHWRQFQVHRKTIQFY